MSIWFKKSASPAQIMESHADTMIRHIGIEITEIGDDFLKGTMPVDHRTVQPMKILHGGANVALAETLGSVAANMVVNNEEKFCVGLEINANHLRSVRTGIVTGIAKPIHLGSSTQVWSIEIFNEEGKLSCTSRITMAVLERK